MSIFFRGNALLIFCCLFAFGCLKKGSSSVSSNPSSTSVDPVIICPTGYVGVPHNSDLGTSKDFCVSKYEMKNVGGVATSQAALAPWVSISQTSSKTTCAALGTGYHLITNEEWMTVARNVEKVDSNWSSGVAGVGVMARGHSDGVPDAALAVSDENNPYSDTGNTSSEAANSGWEQRRTLTLSNKGVLWDMSGNVRDWVDLYIAPNLKPYVAATPITTDQEWKQFKNLDTNVGASDIFKPIAMMPFFSTLTTNEGIGGYYAGTNTTGGGVLRGARWQNGSDAGIYSLNLNNDPTVANTIIGFRCAYLAQ